MVTDTNPYQTPPDVEKTEREPNRVESGFWRFSFWSAVVLTCFGIVAFFVRNMPPMGFWVVALILFLQTAIGSKRFRRRAAVGLICTLIFAVGGLYYLRLTQARNAAQRAYRAELAAIDEYERLVEQSMGRSSGEPGSGDGNNHWRVTSRTDLAMIEVVTENWHVFVGPKNCPMKPLDYRPDVCAARAFLALAFCLTMHASFAKGPMAWPPQTKWPPQTTWPPQTMRGTDGEQVFLEPAKFTVVCFLGTECPLARLYGPRLQSLADQYSDRGVAFLGVNSNLQDSPSEIDAYAEEHSIKFPIVKDADQMIADSLGATRTPEVFVVDSVGMIRYQGRIDDQYEPGIARANPTRNDLRDAIESAVSGEAITHPKTKGVGCLITRIAKPKSNSGTKPDVTFSRDIAPILNKHCVECHRGGEIGPMELTDYDEVVGWGQMMLEVIDQGRMPPWHADPTIGHFVGQRNMPAEERNRIEDWLTQGMPQGDPADQPELPPRNGGWQFATEPDYEFEMRDSPFIVPADGVVEYQYYVVDPKWTDDRWICGTQVIPGDSSVVHHAIVFVRPPDGSGFSGIGWMGAYVPGQRAVPLPPGHARLVPAGSKLVFQMHYTPNGRITPDTSRVGVWEIDPKDVTHEVFTQLAIDHEFEIPPGEKDHVVKMSVDSFPPNSRMLGITPHMHLRGKSFQLDAHCNDDSSVPLLRVPNYDFNWQHWYQFAEPVDLASLKSLHMSVTFDNSKSNPFNPSPADYVSWGDQTWEEMAVAFFDVAIPRGGPKRKPNRPAKLTREQITALNEKINQDTDDFFAKMDVDKDGVITREETPITFRRYGFNRIDNNGDGRIERDEVRSEAGKRL